MVTLEVVVTVMGKTKKTDSEIQLKPVKLFVAKIVVLYLNYFSLTTFARTIIHIG